MIIDKDYDRILYLMMEVDNDNKMRMLDFIKSIPSELYVEIHKSMEEYRFKKNEGDVDFFLDDWSGTFLTEDGKYYYYSLDSYGLLLGLDINYETIIRIFIKTKVISDRLLSLFEEGYGKLSYNYKKLENFGRNSFNNYWCDKVKYKLYRIPFGLIVVSLCEDKISFVKSLDFINRVAIPNDIVISDLEDNKLKKVLSKNIYKVI